MIEELEKILQNTQKIKVIYVIPEFQNPTERTWSLERKEQLAKIAKQYGVMVMEDNPYGELRFEGESSPAVKSFDTEGYVLCTGTFSKIFCPGFRIGWVAGDKEVIQKYILVKQGADLQCKYYCTNGSFQIFGVVRYRKAYC